ncbi:MAG: hypothetical protein COA58_11315 [Bacteroidetes bacterium]|nr:MAG: hypothetical protein COA58_11315 [Bacteroidota bacterium]
MKDTCDSISIELIVQAAQMGKDDIWMQGDLEILINGEKPYSESDIIDVDVFLKSMNSDGEYFIFSCCCGIPECSGWIKGINVKHKENIVTWSDENSNRTWQLDKTKVENDLSNIRNEVKIYKEYFSEKGIKYVGVGYNW